MIPAGPAVFPSLCILLFSGQFSDKVFFWQVQSQNSLPKVAGKNVQQIDRVKLGTGQEKWRQCFYEQT